MEKIDKLPPELEARLPEIQKEWLAIGLSTEPADRKAAEAAVDLAYVAAGLSPPKYKLWYRSPMEGSIAAAAVPTAEAPMSDEELEKLTPAERDRIMPELNTRMTESVLAIAKKMGEKALNQSWTCGYGSQDAGWLSFYWVFRDLIPEVKRLDGLFGLARTCGWWWPFEDVCILTERPNLLHRDPEGRLHSERGPALSYPDGFGIWAIHGVRCPSFVIDEPGRITSEMVLKENNAELRRIMLDRYVGGLAKFLQDSGAEKLHEDGFGTLWRQSLGEDDEPIVMVEVVDATPEPDGSFKHYWLRVPPDTKTAKEGVAWTWAIPEKDYNPSVQT